MFKGREGGREREGGGGGGGGVGRDGGRIALESDQYQTLPYLVIELLPLTVLCW